MQSMNVSQQELGRFAELAARWWDKDGDSRPLHDLNPLRMRFIEEKLTLEGARVADVGCGGGLLSEALTRAGAKVVGIDLGAEVLQVAKLHRHEDDLDIDYRLLSSSQLASEEPQAFDAVCSMELIEHVPDPVALLKDLTHMLKPGGQLILSTVNRTPKAFAGAILGAEYVLRMLPRGTHHYKQFIKPSEIASCLRDLGMHVDEVRGVSYNPFSRQAKFSRNTQINYLLSASKPL